MRTDTTRYEATHGRSPRGRGLWFFQVAGTDGQGAWLTETMSANGSLAEARSQVVREFKAMNGRVKSVTEVVVLP